MWYTFWMLLSFGMLETAKSSTRKMCSFHQICITIIWSLEYANNLGEIRQLQIGYVWNSSTNLPNSSSNWGRFNQVNVGKDHSYNNIILLYKLSYTNFHYMLCYIVRTSVRRQIIWMKQPMWTLCYYALLTIFYVEKLQLRFSGR